MTGYRTLTRDDEGKGWSNARVRIGRNWLTREILVNEVRDTFIALSFGPSFTRREEMDRNSVKVAR